MTIEIHQSRVEALIQRWMSTGRFATVEDALATALESVPETVLAHDQMSPEESGSAVYEALRRCPFPDVDLEPERVVMPVRDFTW